MNRLHTLVAILLLAVLAAGNLDTSGIATYAVIASTTITNTGPTTITGDVALHSGASAAIVGFPVGVITGMLVTADANPSVALATVNAAQTLFTIAKGLACDGTLATELGGLTITPGTYCQSANVGLTGILTLAGPAGSQFVFQLAQQLIVAAGASIVMSGGASACDVWFVTSGSIPIGTTAALLGNFFAAGEVTLANGASIVGRARSATQVTLISNTINAASCQAGSSADPHFAGFRGQRFDVKGKPNTTFNWYSDSDIQMNGELNTNPDNGKTYQTSIGLRFGKEARVQFSVAPNYLLGTYPFAANGTFGDCGRLFWVNGETLVVQWHTYTIKLRTMVPTSGSKRHHHIDMSMSPVARNPETVHGLLGQTHRLSASEQLQGGMQGEGVIEGTMEDYIVADGIFGTHSKFGRFSATEGRLSPAECRALLASPKIVDPTVANAGSNDGI